jgi:hypothetical protein
MGRIADHCLVQISDLNVDFAFNVCDWANISGVAVATDPDIGPGR